MKDITDFPVVEQWIVDDRAAGTDEDEDVIVIPVSAPRRPRGLIVFAISRGADPPPPLYAEPERSIRLECRRMLGRKRRPSVGNVAQAAGVPDAAEWIADEIRKWDIASALFRNPPPVPEREVKQRAEKPLRSPPWAMPTQPRFDW